MKTPAPSFLCILANARHRQSQVIFAAVAFTIAATFVPFVSHADTPSQSELLVQQQALNEDINRIQDWLKQAQQQETSIQKQLATSEKAIDLANRSIQAIEQEAATLHNKADALVRQTKQIQANMHAQEKQLATAIRQQYQLQKRQQSGILFSLAEIEQLGRTLANYRYLTKSQADEIADYRNNLNTFNLLKRQQQETQAAIAKQLQGQQAAQQQLLASQQEQKIALQKLKQKSLNKTQKLKDAKASQAQIQQLLVQLEIALENAQRVIQGQPFAARKGKLEWPVTGTLLNRFGKQSDQYPLSENGWLIATQAGTEVYSVHQGQVVFADWLKGYGLLLIIDHGEGFLTLYGQNQSLYKAAGDKVGVGEVIADSGNSGGQSQQALYFAIRKDGQPQNPKQWLNN